jgi:2-amino-4-hydroxy-6-hydroxymethyldihydropteridine diphosphokinase
LGSNLGDRQAYLEAGLAGLATLSRTEITVVSSVYETAPQGYVDQPPFLNAVAALTTDLNPLDLLHALRRLEDRHLRQRTIPWGPRTLDMDLLLHGDRVLDTPELVLPHPRMTERCFVLAPLIEVDPELRHPVTGRSFRSCCRELGCDDQVRRLGSLALK